MTEQVSLWKGEQQSADFAELCNALYERELHQLATIETGSINSIQARLKSLPYYIQQTARMMMQCTSPLTLDIQNASWSAKQTSQMPIPAIETVKASDKSASNNTNKMSVQLSNQGQASINQWYKSITLKHGLVVPILESNRIVLDCIDKIAPEKNSFRTNAHGWFDLDEISTKRDRSCSLAGSYSLLKPNKRIMSAACSGHCWVNHHKSIPVMPTLRELLLSCSINWRDFKKPVPR